MSIFFRQRSNFHRYTHTNTNNINTITNKMRFFLFLIIFNFTVYSTQAQIWNKVTGVFNKNTELTLSAEELAQIRNDINTLSSPNFNGRKAGSKGEEAAGVFLEQRMNAIGLKPVRNNSYRQHFKFETNKSLSKDCKFLVGNKYIFIPEDAIPLSFSNFNVSEENFAMPLSEEQNAPWILPLYKNKEEALDPNFDWEQAAYLLALKAQKKGASSVILYDEFGATNRPTYKSNSSFNPLNILVVLVNRNAYEKNIKNIKVITPISIKIEFSSEKLIGTNIIAQINNNAAQTIVIGAHYDHLGEQKVSGKYFPGADNNASGVATMLAIATRIKRTPEFKNYNYVFVAFSAYENGMMGAKSFIVNNIVPVDKIACMINLDRVGKIKNNKVFNIEGIGSALAWSELASSIILPSSYSIKQYKRFNSNSEHIEFYAHNIPSINITSGSNVAHNTLNDIPNALNYEGINVISNYTLQLLQKINSDGIKIQFQKIKTEQNNNDKEVSSINP
jgi:aminopeptidase YwaD